MKKMMRLIVMLVTMSMLVLLTACGGDRGEDNANNTAQDNDVTAENDTAESTTPEIKSGGG